MISHRLKEDASDIAVKARLWDATKRELLHFANRYAEEHVVGSRVSDGQEGVVCAASAKGYPRTLVRNLGELARRDMADSDRAREEIQSYQIKLGLLSSGGARHGA